MTGQTADVKPLPSGQEHEYGRHWRAVSQRLDLRASEITDPEHARSYFRHVIRRESADVVSIAASSIRTVAMGERQAAAHACRVAQEMLGLERLRMVRSSRRVRWERVEVEKWDGPEAA